MEGEKSWYFVREMPYWHPNVDVAANRNFGRTGMGDFDSREKARRLWNATKKVAGQAWVQLRPQMIAAWRYHETVCRYYWKARTRHVRAIQDRLSEGRRSRAYHREIQLFEDRSYERAALDDAGWRVQLPKLCVACGKSDSLAATRLRQATPDDSRSAWAPTIAFALACLFGWWRGSFFTFLFIAYGGLIAGYLLRRHVRTRVDFWRCESHKGDSAWPKVRKLRDALVVTVGQPNVRRGFLGLPPEEPGPADAPDTVADSSRGWRFDPWMIWIIGGLICAGVLVFLITRITADTAKDNEHREAIIQSAMEFYGPATSGLGAKSNQTFGGPILVLRTYDRRGSNSQWQIDDKPPNDISDVKTIVFVRSTTRKVKTGVLYWADVQSGHQVGRDYDAYTLTERVLVGIVDTSDTSRVRTEEKTKTWNGNDYKYSEHDYVAESRKQCDQLATSILSQSVPGLFIK